MRRKTETPLAIMRREAANSKAKRLFNSPEIQDLVQEAITKAWEEAESGGEIFAGIVGGDGSFTPSGAYGVTHYPGMTVRSSPTETVWHMKSAGGLRTSKDTGKSQQLTDLDKGDFAKDNVLTPSWNLDVLKGLLLSNVVHAAAVETKANDYAFSGWELTRWKSVSNAIEAGTLSEDEVDKSEGIVRSFLMTCFDGLPVEDLMRDFALEHEGLGISGLEIIRQRDGLLHAIKSIPFDTVRILDERGREANNDARYVQRRFNKKSFFVVYGHNVDYTNPEFDPLRSPFDEFPSLSERSAFMKPATDRWVHAKDGRLTSEFTQAATELYVLARRPFIASDQYGTPSGIQALGSMLAMKKIEEYNLAFFSAKGVPQYAIILKNMKRPAPQMAGKAGTLQNAPGNIAQLQETIKEFFETKLLSGDRSVLVMAAFGDAEVIFEKLSNDQIEASFADYEDRMKEMIRLAHRVPPHAMGIVETANLGGGRDTAQLERYRDHIVVPGQRQMANVVNQLIRTGLLIPFFNFQFTPISINEEIELRDFALKAYKDAALTPNEVRKQLPFELADIPPELGGDVIHIRTATTTRINEDFGVDDDGNMAISAALNKERQQFNTLNEFLLSHTEAMRDDPIGEDEGGGEKNEEHAAHPNGNGKRRRKKPRNTKLV